MLRTLFGIDKVSQGSEETSMYRHIGGLLRYSYVVNAFKNYQDKAGVFLDIGCGQGAYTIEASKFFNRSVGIDISPDNINFCKKRVKEFRLEKLLFSTGDASNIPLPDESYFVVLISEVLEHLPPSKVSNVLMETTRVLIPNGVLLITIPSIFLDYKLNKEGLFQNIILSFKKTVPNKKIILKKRVRKKGAFHNFFTKKEIEYIVASTGFKIFKNQYIVKFPCIGYFIPRPIKRLVKSILYTSSNNETRKELSKITSFPGSNRITKFHKLFEAFPFLGNHIFIGASKL